MRGRVVWVPDRPLRLTPLSFLAWGAPGSTDSAWQRAPTWDKKKHRGPNQRLHKCLAPPLHDLGLPLPPQAIWTSASHLYTEAELISATASPTSETHSGDWRIADHMNQR